MPKSALINLEGNYSSVNLSAAQGVSSQNFYPRPEALNLTGFTPRRTPSIDALDQVGSCSSAPSRATGSWPRNVPRRNIAWPSHVAIWKNRYSNSHSSSNSHSNSNSNSNSNSKGNGNINSHSNSKSISNGNSHSNSNSSSNSLVIAIVIVIVPVIVIAI